MIKIDEERVNKKRFSRHFRWAHIIHDLRVKESYIKEQEHKYLELIGFLIQCVYLIFLVLIRIIVSSMEYLEYISIIKLYQICLSHPIVCNERRQVTDPLD